MSLTTYQQKRDFNATPEPAGKKPARRDSAARFVVQKHAARRLHYDFRLELDGVLKSWAVPKGPSLDPAERSLAVETEDHPLDYATFEGVIPKGQYGAGPVMVWDQGVWEPEGDAHRGLKKGKLNFHLQGSKLHGHWTLVRMSGDSQADGRNWLLIKKQDSAAIKGDGYGLVQREDASVQSHRTIVEVANAREASLADLGQLEGARPGKPPQRFRPQLATLVADIPAGDDWLHEIKFDGYRLLARCDGKVRLITRQGNDWTNRFAAIATALEQMQLTATLLDGEVVVLDENGASDFQALQNVLRNDRAGDILYYVFDAPYLSGYNLTKCRQLDRKEAVRELLARAPKNSPLRYSDHIRGEGADVEEIACRQALEGLISKRADAPYQQKRTRDWVKVKCKQRQEFVIGGYTDPLGTRVGLGALLLGVYEGSRLVYCGRVGTGFNADSLHELFGELKPLEIEAPPFSNPPPGRRAGVHWVDPQLVAEVEFGSWTEDGILRHAVFQGLRLDKSPTTVVREKPKEGNMKLGAISKPTTKAPVSTAGRNLVAGVKISHPDRVVFPEAEFTKLELAEYYADVAERMLPYLANRPLTLLRCPEGRGKDCFYQKHASGTLPKSIHRLEIAEENGQLAEYVTVRDTAGLVSLIQMGTLEIHPWSCRNDRIERPDQLVFDLDPGEGVKWQWIVEAANELKDRLQRLKFRTFLRTTGGKGLHIVVPIQRRSTWPEVKQFAKSLAVAMAGDSPQRYVATSSKAKRVGKIFIDYLRNSRGATAVASYSTRARPGGTIATPLRWDDLTPKLRPDQYTVKNIRQRLEQLNGDPWEGFLAERKSITKTVMKALDGK